MLHRCVAREHLLARTAPQEPGSTAAMLLLAGSFGSELAGAQVASTTLFSFRALLCPVTLSALHPVPMLCRPKDLHACFGRKHVRVAVQGLERRAVDMWEPKAFLADILRALMRSH